MAAILRGHLEGDPRVTVVTRYELRPCEPGLRVRSDLYNGAADPNTLYLTDGFFWGDQTLAPFVPGPGLGFRAPEVELLHIDRAWREWPFMAARAVPGRAATSRTPSSPATGPQAAGFSSTTLTRVGRPARADAAGRRLFVRALHPRRARAGAGARGRVGAARSDHAARRSRAA